MIMKKYLYVTVLLVPCLLRAAVAGLGGDERKIPRYVEQPVGISQQQSTSAYPTKAVMPLGKLPVIPPKSAAGSSSSQFLVPN